ncbi:cytochrome P450 [Planktothrix sp. FACHB-1375]|uniref:Cytochrome P450 n=1 Tax=Aerosakkonema funiforme FACHB-1375 TaxID=2949571 RepID=A0A926VNA3_9CYAN|nr:cytochrome P450 [Aerosakkonema funiforme]MBD2186348.1 cytochrome P450 [Aerosakkonema funiforme FACHB-1375]
MTKTTEARGSLPLPPGSFGLPLIGETVSFLRDRNFVNNRQKKYGPIFKTHIMGRPTVFMTGAEANRFILSSHMDRFSWREGWPDTFKELLGESLFLQEGAEHQRNRKLLMPAFHGKALGNYLSVMERMTQNYLQKWERLGSFTWFPEFKQLTFEIASFLLIGSEPGEETTQLSQWFTELTDGFFTVPLRWPWTTYGRALRARDRLLVHIEKAVLHRQQEPAQDALGLLVQSRDEEGNRLSMQELKVQALLMLFAGHETTTSMLTSFCMALAQHPDVWTRARAEQQKLAGDGSLTMEQIKQMTYLEQVLREVERLYPPVGGGFRCAIEPFEFNGYYVPKGWQITYRIPETHQDSRIFSQPEQFDPDRFK